VGTHDGLGRHAEGWGSPVAVVHRAAFEDLATGDGIAWSEAEPGATVCVIRPLAPGSTDVRQDGLRQGIAEDVDAVCS
jgi:hypothetical protein